MAKREGVTYSFHPTPRPPIRLHSYLCVTVHHVCLCVYVRVCVCVAFSFQQAQVENRERVTERET
jgi:hypothetical protein